MKKALLIVVVAIVVVILGLMALFSLKGDKLAAFAIEKSIPYVQTTVMKNLPQDVSAEEVKTYFTKLTDKIKSGKYDKAEAQQLLLTFKKSMENKKIDSEEVKKMIESVKKLAGE